MASKALIVTVSEYANPSNSLVAVAKDGPAFAEILAGYGIHDTEILKDKNATSQNIRNALHQLVTGAQAGDTCVFYFSGHGFHLPPSFSGNDDPDGRDEAIVPHEGTLSSLILDNWLAQFFKNRIPEGVVFWGIYDCCHSGDLFKAAVIDGIGPEEIEIAKELQVEDIIIDSMPTRLAPIANFTQKGLILDGTIPTSIHVAAAQPEKPALCKLIDGEQRSVFTWALSQVLHGAPKISVADLEIALAKKVATHTDVHTPQVACHPSNRTRLTFY